MSVDNSKLKISDHKYWIELVSRLGANSSVYQPAEVPSLKDLFESFDSTKCGLLLVWNSIDSDNDQTISEREVARVLRQKGMYTHRGSQEGDAAFRELMNMISIPSSREGGSSSSGRQLHQPAFLAVLINLRLGAILCHRQFGDHDLRMNLHEFRGNQPIAFSPVKNPVAFLFKPASELFLKPDIQVRIPKTSYLTGGENHQVQWAHVHEASNKVILALTVQCRLDPRFVGDVFERRGRNTKALRMGKDCIRYQLAASAIGDSPLNKHCVSASSSLEHTPNIPRLAVSPTIDTPKWFTMVVPILRLSEKSRKTLQKYQEWRGSVSSDTNSIDLDAAPCVEIIVEHCDLAMCVSVIPGGTSAVCFSSNWVELMNLSTVPIGLGKIRINNIPNTRSSTEAPIKESAIERNHSRTESSPSDRFSGTAQSSMFNKALADISLPDSPLRTGDAHAFLLKVLCDITDDYLLIAQAYEAYLEILDRRTDKEKHNLNSKEVTRIKECITQLSQLYKLVKPLTTRTDSFSSSEQLSRHATLYMSDIKSNISTFLDSVATSAINAKYIIETHNSYTESRKGTVGNILALFATAWLPAQLLTGLYGMNFTYNDEPSLPELGWEHGYLYFWIMVLCMTSLICGFFYKKGFIPTN